MLIRAAPVVSVRVVGRVDWQ